MTGPTIALLIAAVVVAWLAFWVAVVRLIARFGGWRSLAEQYPLDRAAFDGERFRMQSIVLRRWVAYNGAVTVTVNRDGMVLTVLSIFRPGHRPIFLPWPDLNATSGIRDIRKGLWRPVVKLEPRRLPQVPVTISKALADRIAAVVGDAWPQPVSVDQPG